MLILIRILGHKSVRGCHFVGVLIALPGAEVIEKTVFKLINQAIGF